MTCIYDQYDALPLRKLIYSYDDSEWREIFNICDIVESVSNLARGIAIDYNDLLQRQRAKRLKTNIGFVAYSRYNLRCAPLGFVSIKLDIVILYDNKLSVLML
jgi:hypothetical protein